jgi:hypothetical protein
MHMARLALPPTALHARISQQARHAPHCMTTAPGWNFSMTLLRMGLNRPRKVLSSVPSLRGTLME